MHLEWVATAVTIATQVAEQLQNKEIVEEGIDILYKCIEDGIIF